MQTEMAPPAPASRVPATPDGTGLPPAAISTLEAQTMRKVSKRLVPFLLIAYLVSVIDRTNIGFAGMQMSQDVGLTQSMFGLAGGIFFVSYFLCEVPSNLALERFGARRWLSRIMISWGVVAGASALVIGPKTFFTMRLILGAAEAGFLPGAIYYLTHWFPSAYRSRVMAWFVLSVAGGRPAWFAYLRSAPEFRRRIGFARLAMVISDRSVARDITGRCSRFFGSPIVQNKLRG